MYKYYTNDDQSPYLVLERSKDNKQERLWVDLKTQAWKRFSGPICIGEYRQISRQEAKQIIDKMIKEVYRTTRRDLNNMLATDHSYLLEEE